MRRAVHIAAAAAVSVLALSAPALAWDPFLVENDDVEAGNERMAARDAAGALTQYERAARALPAEAGVHLNRGLALMESGELDRAREAFLLATEPPAATAVRADAYYDLGLAFYRQGDAAASEENHEEAQRLFREAADAFRQSLRIRPGNADAGWNLELALRRIREQEERQQQQEEQEEQDEQNQDQQNQDQQNQDQQNQDQQNQDQQNQDEQNQDQQSQDQQSQDQQSQDQQSQDEQSQDQQNQDQQSQDEPGGDESSDESDPSQDPGSQEGQDGSGSQGEASPTEPPPGGTRDGLPPEHRRVLDALEQGEENLERHRARARAAQERRRVEQDW